MQFHRMEKLLVIHFHNMEKMLIILFSYNFGDKKTAEKAQVLVPVYGKNACYKIPLYGKKSFFLLFSYTYFCSMKLYERV